MAKKKKPKSKRQTFRVEVTTTVAVDIDDRLTPTQEWRDSFYQLHSLREVAEHIAYNFVANGAHSLRQLDGFADRDDSDAVVKVLDTEVSADL